DLMHAVAERLDAVREHREKHPVQQLERLLVRQMTAKHHSIPQGCRHQRAEILDVRDGKWRLGCFGSDKLECQRKLAVALEQRHDGVDELVYALELRKASKINDREGT